jgi:transglutaminase-like putative cysteine protease
VLCAFALVPALGFADEGVMSEALGLRQRGEFEKASQLMRSFLEETSTTLGDLERRAVEFEIERINRIRQDYTVTRNQLLERIQKRLPDFTEEELDGFEREGHFDVQVIDGQKLYVGASARNIFLRLPELRAREKDRKPDGTYRKLYAHMLRVREARAQNRDSLVLPQDFAVTYTLTVKPNAAPEGETVRCWLPYVRAYPFQTDAFLLESDPPDSVLAAPEAPHRTAYLEKKAVKDAATVFSVKFIYRCWARANSIDPATVLPYDKDGPEYAYYTADRKPHLDLTNELLRKLNPEIVGGETNPFLVARRIYDWIANNTIYQYAREYSTLDNISHYTAARRAGDCGQHGMLFIALCRMNGIPARWQSGWESFEARGNNMHDWCEFYVEPFGWLPADPDMAVNFIHYGADQLDSTQTRALVDFMFASMDHYRLATNSDFGAPLVPAKNDFRSETVDFQRGEVEAANRNLYFDKWSYDMDIQPVSPEVAADVARRFVPPPVELPPFQPAKPAPVALETTATASPVEPAVEPKPEPAPVASETTVSAAAAVVPASGPTSEVQSSETAAAKSEIHATTASEPLPASSPPPTPAGAAPSPAPADSVTTPPQ